MIRANRLVENVSKLNKINYHNKTLYIRYYIQKTKTKHLSPYPT